MDTCSVASFAVNTTFQKLPASVVARAKVGIIDTLGVMLAGLETRTASIARELAASMRGVEESTLFGTHIKVPAPTASFANSIAASVLDWDDGHWVGSHAGAVVIPGALAMAESQKASGKGLIEAVVAGYEVATRAHKLWRPREKQPIHRATGAGGAYGAAAAAGKILGLNREEMTNALGISDTHSPLAEVWVITTTGCMTKECIGWGAMTGVTAALLAKRGFYAPKTVFDDPDVDVSMLETLGKTYETLNFYVKPYPACRLTHNAIDALLEIIQKHSLTSEDISQVVVETHTRAGKLNSKRPITIEQAQYSYPFLLGAVLAEGKLGAEEMADDRLADAKILRQAKKVKLVVNPRLDARYPARYPNIVRVETKDKKHYEMSKEFAKGNVENPLSNAEIEQKFLSSARKALGTRRARSLLETIQNLEDMPGVERLAELLRAASPGK
ncbi:MAG: MmgE/PrpD family protein [Chloroflexi bacterium]|nr:MmgE/PrpD family protein [Chloroflexota bacterium]